MRCMAYLRLAWEVEGTDEFAGWFQGLADEQQVSVGRVIELLVEQGRRCRSRIRQV